MSRKIPNSDDYINTRSMSDRWITLEYNDCEDFDETEIFALKDFYVPFIPNETHYLYADEVSKYGMPIVFRDFGKGTMAYTFEIVYVRIISEEHTKRMKYLVANEVLHKNDLSKYERYCRCSRCKLNHTMSRIMHDINPFKKSSTDEPCLKKGTCTNDLLKKSLSYMTEQINHMSKESKLSWREISNLYI